MSKHRAQRFTDQLRRLIDESDESRYAIWQATGIDQATLCRFMTGKGGLSLEGLDKLVAHLGLELRPTRTGKEKRNG